MGAVESRSMIAPGPPVIASVCRTILPSSIRSMPAASARRWASAAAVKATKCSRLRASFARVPEPTGPRSTTCEPISASSITIANASDLSGPIPGLFKSAEQATQAYAAYFNATSTICGRKLAVQPLDSATSSSGDQQAALTACGSAFAMVGSMSAFDDGGAATVDRCGIPDLRSISVNPQRGDSPVSFGTDSIKISEVPTAVYSYLKRVGGTAYQHAAMVYLTAGATVINGHSFRKAAEAVGYQFVYDQALDVTTFNYAPYVADMQSKGVKLVQWAGPYQNAVRLRQAMSQQGFNPIFLMDSVAYDPALSASGGSAVNGTYAFVDTSLFEERSHNAQMQTYLTWLNRVAPGATPSFFGLFAWGAAKLFTQLAVQLGGRLSRSTMLAAIGSVHGYTADGLFAPQDVGGKHSSHCQVVIRLLGGAWTRMTAAPFTCGPVVSTGIGN